jgi:hypothetical protein
MTRSYTAGWDLTGFGIEIAFDDAAAQAAEQPGGVVGSSPILPTELKNASGERSALRVWHPPQTRRT